MVQHVGVITGAITCDLGQGYDLRASDILKWFRAVLQLQEARRNGSNEQISYFIYTLKASEILVQVLEEHKEGNKVLIRTYKTSRGLTEKKKVTMFIVQANEVGHTSYRLRSKRSLSGVRHEMSKNVEMETSLLCGLWGDEKSCPHSEKGCVGQWRYMRLCGQMKLDYEWVTTIAGQECAHYSQGAMAFGVCEPKTSC